MARTPTKTTRKATDTGTSTTVAREAPASDQQQAGTAVIKFDKTVHGGRVRGAVNGQRFDFPVDSDVTVTEAQLEALTNSGAKFTTVTPLAGEGAAEGSAAPSTTVTGTALRAEVPPQPQVDEDGNVLPTPELRQITDKELVEDRVDQQTSKESAEAEAK